MKAIRMSLPVTLLAAASLTLLAGCEGKPAAPGNAKESGAAPAVVVPETLFVQAAPAGAVEVAAAKQTAKPGDTIVVHGRIGGGQDPFVDNRAMFTLADMSMPICSERPGDSCPTPWDYCCEPSDVIVKNTATVQVVDSGGRPLKTGLKGAGGLKPTSEIIVKGTVSARPDDKSLVLDAASIFVKP
jgi:hypothetical protein